MCFGMCFCFVGFVLVFWDLFANKTKVHDSYPPEGWWICAYKYIAVGVLLPVYPLKNNIGGLGETGKSISISISIPSCVRARRSCAGA